MPRDYLRGKCDRCNARGRVWSFQLKKVPASSDSSKQILLCGKCQQVLRHARKIIRNPGTVR